MEAFFQAAVDYTGRSSVGRLRFFMGGLVDGITFEGRRVPDVGGGRGILSMCAVARGTVEAVCLEPLAEGSRENTDQEFNDFRQPRLHQRPPLQGATESSRGPHVSLLYLGWLEERKAIFDLIDAFAMYRQQLEDARVIVCGRGSNADAARERVRRLGLENASDFRGWVSGEEKVRVLKESDVLVIPSHAEGLPNVLLEGMAAALAVVATDVGAIRETLGDRVGILVGRRDPESLGAALVRVCSEPDMRESFGVEALRRVVERHSAARTWPRLFAALANSLGLSEPEARPCPYRPAGCEHSLC